MGQCSCNTLTFDLWISDSALGAAADGPVPQHQAVGARAAVAGVSAESVDACLLGGALVVAHAAGRVLQLHRLAAPVRHGDPAGAARADHGPEGDGVDHAADGGGVAGAQLVARVAAPLIQA